MDVKIKKLNDLAVIPSYAKPGDAGMDLTAINVEYDEKIDCYVYHTGLAVEIPEGYVGLIFPRSSNRKSNVYLPNSVGVIDSSYRGEIMVCYKDRTNVIWYGFANALLNQSLSLLKALGINKNEKLDVNNSLNAPYQQGDRVAQLIIMPYPNINFVESKELSETERGDGGFGSTNKE